MTASADPADARQVVVVGRIQAPYGIKGWVHIAAYTEPRDNILGYRHWMVSASQGGSDAWRALDLAELKPHKQGFVARIRGIADRNAAESVKGFWIGVPESELPEPPADEYYWRDLIGMVVIDQNETCLGRVVDMMETGAHDVLVIAVPESADDQENAGDRDQDQDQEKENEPLLIPFHRQYVHDVNPAKAEIRVEWAG